MFISDWFFWSGYAPSLFPSLPVDFVYKDPWVGPFGSCA